MEYIYSGIGKTLCVLISVICIVFLIYMNINDRGLEQQTAEEVAKVNEDAREAEKELAQEEAERKAAELVEKEANDSFYQKLADGFNVKILIVGDTIANGYGASSQEHTWAKLLKKRIEEDYRVEVTLDNESILDTGAYAAYASVKMINDQDYDLTIICTGAYDKESTLPVHYEAALRAIQSKFKKCSVICVQEYMETEDNARNLSIQTLANAYNAYTADIHTKMAGDPTLYMQGGGYLNDAGHELYADTIYSIIKSGVNSKAEFKITQEAPISEEAAQYEQFLFVPADRFNRSGSQYSFETSFTGIIAVDFAVPPGENTFDVYVDRSRAATYTVTNTISVPVEHIELIEDTVSPRRRISIVFGSNELADNFRGMCVTTTE